MQKYLIFFIAFLSACATGSSTQSSDKFNHKDNHRFAGFWECEAKVKLDDSQSIETVYQQVYNPKNSNYYSMSVITFKYKKDSSFSLGFRPLNLIFLKESRGKLEVTNQKIIQHSLSSTTTLSKETKEKLQTLDKDDPMVKLAEKFKRHFNSNQVYTVEENIIKWTKNKLVVSIEREDGSEYFGYCSRLPKEKAHYKLRNMKI